MTTNVVSTLTDAVNDLERRTNVLSTITSADKFGLLEDKIKNFDERFRVVYGQLIDAKDKHSNMKLDSLLSNASSNDNQAAKIDQVFETYRDKLRSYTDQAKKLNAKTITVANPLRDNASEDAFSIARTLATTPTMSLVVKPYRDVDTNPLLLDNVMFEKFMKQDICLPAMT